VGMMEEIERGRGRGLPLDALEGRLELLRRRGVLALGGDESEQLVALVADLKRSEADGSAIEGNLVGWFTRFARRTGDTSANAVSTAEAYVDYLLDVSGDGELRAFEKLTAALAARSGGETKV
jgi:hypothetical protein